jgi:RNA polymerase sigma-70 factor (ECF subfamily)
MKPFDHEKDLWNWLRMIARTAWIDRFRKGSREPRPLSLSGREAAAAAEKAEEEDPAAALVEDLGASLERLDGEERRLVEGKYFGGLSHDELARRFGVSRKAIESRLARIRKKLKVLIMERLEQ